MLFTAVLRVALSVCRHHSRSPRIFAESKTPMAEKTVIRIASSPGFSRASLSLSDDEGAMRNENESNGMSLYLYVTTIIVIVSSLANAITSIIDLDAFFHFHYY